MSFCTKCGRLKVAMYDGRFDEETGQPVMRDQCPNPCHEGHHNFGDWVPRVSCKRCGISTFSPAAYVTPSRHDIKPSD